MAKKKLFRALINTVSMSFLIYYETWLKEISEISWEKNWERVSTKAGSAVCAPFLCSSVSSGTSHL